MYAFVYTFTDHAHVSSSLAPTPVWDGKPPMRQSASSAQCPQSISSITHLLLSSTVTFASSCNVLNVSHNRSFLRVSFPSYIPSSAEILLKADQECRDLAGSLDTQHECGAVGARVQWSQWFSGFLEEGIAAQTRQRMRGANGLQEVDKDKTKV